MLLLILFWWVWFADLKISNANVPNGSTHPLLEANLQPLKESTELKMSRTGLGDAHEAQIKRISVRSHER